jgi:hypothetical protein
MLIVVRISNIIFFVIIQFTLALMLLPVLLVLPTTLALPVMLGIMAPLLRNLFGLAGIVITAAPLKILS